jgi:SAM-dependent methyltransferase
MNCRVCSSSNLEMVVDLGMHPWCNNFLTSDQIGKEPYYPLRLLYCKKCSLSQLDYTVSKEIMFGDHTYLSGVTNTLSNHFKQIARVVDSTFFLNTTSKSILDIGSNDGTQLKHYQDLGWEVLGVESSKTTAKLANDNSIKTLEKFFNLETMMDIDRKFDVINASGVFFHLEELHSVTEGIKLGLKDEGVFVVQFLYMKNIMENNAFDQIYHEHLLYYSLKTLTQLLSKYKLEIFDAQLTSVHGGQMIAYVSHTNKRKKTSRLTKLELAEEISQCNNINTYLDFNLRIKNLKTENIQFLEEAKNKNKRVFGMGAPVKGNTLLNYFDIGTNLVECLLEKNKLRKGLYSPGKHIPILMEDEKKDLPSIYYVLAWNFKDEILNNNKHLVEKGIKFYFPINPKEV